MTPVLWLLEPFALDLWRDEIAAWLPEEMPGLHMHKQTFFGGLYQMVEIRRAEDT